MITRSNRRSTTRKLDIYKTCLNNVPLNKRNTSLYQQLLRGYHMYILTFPNITTSRLYLFLSLYHSYGEYSRTFLCDSVSIKLPRLRFDFVERVRRMLEERVPSPPRRPPRQKKMVAKKKHATDAQAKPMRYLPTWAS